MKKKRWKKIESIVDRGLFMESSEKRRKYIKKASDSVELYEEVCDWISSIEEAEQNGFLE